MESNTGREYVEKMVGLVTDIARGHRDSVQALLDLTIPGQAPDFVCKLAEAIGKIVVQNEAKAFKLELMIEDLLAMQLALEQARHDPLTGLPNRAMFHDTLCRQCSQARECGRLMALLFFDLDKFKEVNDTLGHQAGDELLVQVARRLEKSVGRQGVVARQGGDEFTLLLPYPAAEQDAEVLACQIVSEVSQPFALSSGDVQVSCSVGISFFPEDADSPLTLLKNADVAMYDAKHHGRNTYKRYTNGDGQEPAITCGNVE